MKDTRASSSESETWETWTEIDEKLSGLYGELWESKTASEASTNQWLAHLARIDRKIALMSLNKILQGKTEFIKYPPNVLEFMKLCEPSYDELGIPDADTAYRYAVKGNWIHPIIWQAVADVGVFEFRNTAESVIRPRFIKCYEGLAKRVMKGEKFQAPVSTYAKLESKISKVEAARMSKEQAEEAIKNLRRAIAEGQAMAQMKNAAEGV